MFQYESTFLSSRFNKSTMNPTIARQYKKRRNRSSIQMEFSANGQTFNGSKRLVAQTLHITHK